MAFEHFIDAQRQRFRAVFHGTITKADLQAHVMQRLAEGSIEFDGLIDYTDATLQVDYDDAFSINGLVNDLISKGASIGRTAVLSPSPINFGSNRMLISGVDDVVSVRTFRTMEEAHEWLGWRE